IEEVHQKGGGRVTVPRGMWLTGPIALKSNINLHLEDGALLLFSKEFDEYPLIETSFEGLNTIRCVSPISARHVENIAITGKGNIEGRWDAERLVLKCKLTSSQWKALRISGGVLTDAQDIWFASEFALSRYVATSNFNVPDTKDLKELESMKDF